jgi:hypothetical protein
MRATDGAVAAAPGILSAVFESDQVRQHQAGVIAAAFHTHLRAMSALPPKADID